MDHTIGRYGSYLRGPLPCKSFQAWTHGPTGVQGAAHLNTGVPEHLNNAQAPAHAPSMPIVSSVPVVAEEKEESFLDKVSKPSYLRILVGAGLTWYFLRSVRR